MVYCNGNGVCFDQKGITEAEVRTVEDVTDVLERGNQNRKVAQTAMNSSR